MRKIPGEQTVDYSPTETHFLADAGLGTVQTVTGKLIAHDGPGVEEGRY